MVLYFQETVILKKNRDHANLGGNRGDGDRWRSQKGGNSGWVLSKHIIQMHEVFQGKKVTLDMGESTAIMYQFRNCIQGHPLKHYVKCSGSFYVSLTQARVT